VTQNPYAQQPQQGPPPGWPPGPAQQQAGPPPGWKPAPAYGTPPPAQPASTGEDAFGDPGGDDSFDGDAPALHQLAGRLILWRPRKNSISQGTPYGKPTELEDKMRVDIIVLDGPPIAAHINGDTQAQTPFATGPKVAPFYLGGVQVNKVILKKLMDYHNSPDPKSTCLARFVKTPPKGQGKPYNDLAVATDQDKATARELAGGPSLQRWDELKTAADIAGPARPDQFGGPAQQGPPPVQWNVPAPAQQSAPAVPGPGGYTEQWNAPQQQPAPAGPPPGWTPPPAQQPAPAGPPPAWAPTEPWAGQPPY